MLDVILSVLETNAENCRRWRKKRKIHDPDFSTKEAVRKRQDRKERTPAQIERDRNTARERMKRYREKKNSEKQQEHVVTGKDNHIILTRNQREKLRLKWSDAKRKYRVNLGLQKKRRIKEKERFSKQTQRTPTIDVSKLNKSETCPQDSNSNDDYTPQAKRQAICRIKKKLPTEPKKYASVVSGLLNTTTRKRKALSSILSLTPSKKQRLHFLEESLKSVGEKLEKHKSSGKTKDI